jgi:nucleotide-binding universal stress UspA family protein
MSTFTDHRPLTLSPETLFSQVLVGVDGSPESSEAVRQAAVLATSGGALTVLAAWDLAPPIVTPMTILPAHDAEEEAARREAEDAVQTARQLLPTARTIVVHDFAAHALIDEIDRARSTLVVVGSHGQARTVGILTGSTATQLLHHAPCSVLLARRMRDVPRRIAVGVDGSPESAAAHAVARHLAERFNSDLTVVVAEGDKRLDVASVSLIAGDGLHVIPDEPVPVLVAASADADLLVLGSRGLHGVKSLGSVSERVAHRSECSTLIVRAPAQNRVERHPTR